MPHFEMAQVFYESDTPNIYDLNLTANEILTKHISNEQLVDFDLFFGGRKIGRDQKLSDIKGLTPGKILRIMNRKTSRVQAPPNLREQVVELDKRMEEYGYPQDQLMLKYLYNKNYVKQLINEYPIIIDEPILLSVLTDYSLLAAMLHEEVGFIQKHPSYVPILKQILDTAVPAAPDFMNMLRALNPRRQRNAPDGGNSPPAAAATPRPVFTNQMLQDALLRTAIGDNSANAPAAASSTAAPSEQAPPQPDSTAATPAPPEVPVNRYATQLAQLHDMGFIDDDVNVVILDSVDGNVEEATNLLFAMRD